MSQPSTNSGITLHGLDTSALSYAEAQEKVFFQLREPTYVPEGLSLSRIALFVPPAERAQTTEQRESLLLKLRTADWRSLGMVWVTSVYRGTDPSWQPSNGYFVVEQGDPFGLPQAPFPSDAQGTVTLTDGSQASWIRGAWNRRPGTPGAQWQDNGEIQLYWELSDGVAVKLLVFYMSLEEAVKIANSLQPVPRG
jgi:hypothetical protein